MFWKKKQVAGTPATTGTAPAAGAKPSATKVEAPLKPKAEKPKVEKLLGPRQMPGLVEKHIIAEYKMDPDLVRILKAVVRTSSTEEGIFNIRIFDESEALAKNIQVKGYTSLDQHPDLIIYEGWFNGSVTFNLRPLPTLFLVMYPSANKSAITLRVCLSVVPMAVASS